MVIQELKPSKRVRGRWLAVLEDGSLLRVGEGEVIQFALCAGRELTEEEAEVCQRGRNAHVSHVPKNSSVADYHAATAFECLFGYLYLSGRLDRLRLFFEKIAEAAQAGG